MGKCGQLFWVASVNSGFGLIWNRTLDSFGCLISSCPVLYWLAAEINLLTFILDEFLMLFTEQLHAFGILVCTCGHGTGIMVNFAAVRYFTTQTGPITATVAAFLKKKRKKENVIIFESVQSLLPCLVAVFCLAEVSLFCFHQSVVALLFLQKSISHTTLPSLRFSTLSVFPCFASYCEYCFSSYPLNSETLIPHPPSLPVQYNIVYMSWGLDEG